MNPPLSAPILAFIDWWLDTIIPDVPEPEVLATAPGQTILLRPEQRTILLRPEQRTIKL